MFPEQEQIIALDEDYILPATSEGVKKFTSGCSKKVFQTISFFLFFSQFFSFFSSYVYD